MQDFYNEVKTQNTKTSFYLGTGANIVRLLSQPIKIEEAFCIATYKDKDTGEEKVMKRSEIVYPNCGYQKYASAKFVAYAIDSKDPKNEDGTPKIKTLSFGWKVLEGIVEQEKSRELQGAGVFTFPMSLDAIISKNGSGKNSTTYSVTMMLSEANNKVPFTVEQLQEALKTLPTLREWKEELIAETIARHEKFGVPKAEKQIQEEEEKGGADLPTVQIDADEDADGDSEKGEDIPF